MDSATSLNIFFPVFFNSTVLLALNTYLRLRNLPESSKSRWDRPFSASSCLNFNTDNIRTKEARSCVLTFSRNTGYCCKLRILVHRLWPHPFLCVFENAHFFLDEFAFIEYSKTLIKRNTLNIMTLWRLMSGVKIFPWSARRLLSTRSSVTQCWKCMKRFWCPWRRKETRLVFYWRKWSSLWKNLSRRKKRW